MLTAIISHPKFPDFKTTIRYCGRIEKNRQERRLNAHRTPSAVLIAGTNTPLLDSEGDPKVIYRADLDDQFTIDCINDWLIKMEGMPSEIAEQFADLEKEAVGRGVLVLINELLDVDGEVPSLNTDGTFKRDDKSKVVMEPGLVSWTSVLTKKAFKRDTFIPVPTGAGSPAS